MRTTNKNVHLASIMLGTQRKSTLRNKAFLLSIGHSKYTDVENCVHKNIPQEFKSSSERRSGSL